MTKEEIIKHLHEALDYVDFTFPYRYVFVDAIEALSQPSLPSNLDEAAVQEHIRMEESGEGMTFLNTFKAGAKWQKEQMMKDAVEADVNTYKELHVGKSWAEFVVEMPTSNLGDKVRLIVLPMEE